VRGELDELPAIFRGAAALLLQLTLCILFAFPVLFAKHGVLGSHSAIIFSDLGLRNGDFTMPVLEVFGAWCAVSFAVAGLWTSVIYLGHWYRQVRNARRWARMLDAHTTD
jgi:hypothetical protein